MPARAFTTAHRRADEAAIVLHRGVHPAPGSDSRAALPGVLELALRLVGVLAFGTALCLALVALRFWRFPL